MQDWVEKIRQELAPSHGRYQGALRTAFAATIAAALLLVLQVPMIAPGLYLIFMVSYDVPYLTFRRSVQEVTSQLIGVVIALTLIQITGNDPMARVLGIAAFTFISAFMLQACTARVVAMNIGIFPVLTLSLWEYHLPAKLLVYLSMAPVLTGAVSVGCKVAVEYLFTQRNPRRALRLERLARLKAMRTLFALYGNGASKAELEPAIASVSRLAFTGQSKMLSLLEEVESTPAHEDEEASFVPATIPALARMLDLAASFGRQHPDGADTADRGQALRIVAGLEAIEAHRLDQWEMHEHREAGRPPELLETFERALDNLGLTILQAQTRRREQQTEARELKPAALKPHPWFKADAWTNPEYMHYATRLSICCTLCYIIYNALQWPGISTATLTVMVAGLSTTGATNQKMLLRLVGVLFGGVLFGIGCIVFVYPFSDTLLPFLLSIGLVSFVAAWIARSAHLGYVGLQLAFSFYLTVFQEYAFPMGKTGERAHIDMAHNFAAPVVMTPGRDRLLGVLLALLVMWAVFHRIHPERAVEKMRRELAQLLRLVAEALPLFGKGASGRITALRDQAETIVVEVRALAEAIPYELDQNVGRDLEMSESIQSAISTAGSLLLHTAAASQHYGEEDASLQTAEDLKAKLTAGLLGLSAMLEDGLSQDESPPAPPPEIPAPTGEPAIPESLQEAAQAYSILHQQCMAIRAS